MNATPAVEFLPDGSIRSKVYARIGLLGNPSDGSAGKVLSLSLANFWAQVHLTPSSTLHFQLNPVGDPTQFSTLTSFQAHIEGNGYNGGVRLLMAMTKVLLDYCRRHQIELDSTRLFNLSYETTIPRQRGLSGSSAIACAALDCMLEYYEISNAVPVAARPALVLQAEEELGITAGLQDRIIQVYGGLVYMDFSRSSTTANSTDLGTCTTGDTGECTNPSCTTTTTINIDSAPQKSTSESLESPLLKKEKGNLPPRCKSLDPGLLPPLLLIYAHSPSGKNSGSVHSDFKQRWQQGDAQLRHQMNEVASLAEQGAALLESRNGNGNLAGIGPFMRRNFELRRAMFGDAALGKEGLKMVEVANSVGVDAKFTGSGGAVVALAPEGEEEVARLRDACEESGFMCVPVVVGPIHHLTS